MLSQWILLWSSYFGLKIWTVNCGVWFPFSYTNNQDFTPDVDRRDWVIFPLNGFCWQDGFRLLTKHILLAWWPKALMKYILLAGLRLWWQNANSLIHSVDKTHLSNYQIHPVDKPIFVWNWKASFLRGRNKFPASCGKQLSLLRSWARASLVCCGK